MPYLVRGGKEQLAPVLQHLGLLVGADADVDVSEYIRFGVDDARGLSIKAASRPIRAANRTFVIIAADMTSEAQNALLKTLEEPPAAAQFVFIVPSPETLLPTVRSRMRLLALDTSVASSDAAALSFLRAARQKRLDMLKPLLETDDDKPRDVGMIVAFLGELERACGRDPESLNAIYRARKHAMDKGALLKPLLEQVALLVPTR